ncbi:hypothetical protein TWF694_003332 [Orbilia ellipsospora]|uniref:Uncharacterized protein n=1 Tax=Orbilia ellipsospora TaxID=2528407 RepID=A0AAV9X2F2_9PEZI
MAKAKLLSDNSGIALERALDEIQGGKIGELLPYQIYEQILQSKGAYLTTGSPMKIDKSIYWFLGYITEALEENFVSLKSTADLLGKHRSLSSYAAHLPMIFQSVASIIFTQATLCSEPQNSSVRWREACNFKGDTNMIDESHQSIRKKVLQKYGTAHYRTIHVYNMLARLMVRSPNESERNHGQFIMFGIFHVIQRSNVAESAYAKHWLIRCIGSLGEALLACGGHGLAIKFMKQAIGRYKQGLRDLFLGFHYLRNIHGLYHDEVTRQIGYITDMMNRRGPVLYACLDSAFSDMFSALEASGRAQSRVYQHLSRAWEREGTGIELLRDEYKNALALRFRQRSSTPGLQEFIHFEGLRDWMYFQETSLHDAMGEALMEDELDSEFKEFQYRSRGTGRHEPRDPWIQTGAWPIMNFICNTNFRESLAACTTKDLG